MFRASLLWLVFFVPATVFASPAADADRAALAWLEAVRARRLDEAVERSALPFHLEGTTSLVCHGKELSPDAATTPAVRAAIECLLTWLTPISPGSDRLPRRFRHVTLRSVSRRLGAQRKTIQRFASTHDLLETELTGWAEAQITIVFAVQRPKAAEQKPAIDAVWFDFAWWGD